MARTIADGPDKAEVTMTRQANVDIAVVKERGLTRLASILARFVASERHEALAIRGR